MYVASFPFTLDFSVEELLTALLATQFDVGISILYGTVRDYRGQIVPNGRVFLYLKWGPQTVIESDENGYFSIECMEGEEITIVIPDAMYDKKIIVPPLETTQTSAEINSLPAPTEAARWNFPTIRFRV